MPPNAGGRLTAADGSDGPAPPPPRLASHSPGAAELDDLSEMDSPQRSKLTGRRGAAEVAGDWVAWERDGMPVER